MLRDSCCRTEHRHMHPQVVLTRSSYRRLGFIRRTGAGGAYAVVREPPPPDPGAEDLLCASGLAPLKGMGRTAMRTLSITEASQAGCRQVLRAETCGHFAGVSAREGRYESMSRRRDRTDGLTREGAMRAEGSRNRPHHTYMRA
ncbi:hypothetical protein BU23DRAFT_4088 [Bimuria novae-zelandiae CBS 107.79]|uniref:Uncharacterized protein n=1 Tax=Bimuria novae-zelandiae CBS 107.79 TaxID=1447943 RepID=A0A6A5W3Z3_9PLEO|nr:hypothetical protein BU23DRAFT_4088 [Bimuria novae-zelandiae CBS 107.79]